MFIKNFTELGKNDAGIAGGKGASLGEMTQAGIPVPPGFVVLSEAFEQFLQETDLSVEIDTILHTVSTDKMHTVEHASERIQKLILEAEMPGDIRHEIESHFQELGSEFVAVRSSATAEDSASAAWAGQLDSFLNTTHATFIQNVQKCWASLFTPRAIFYRFEQGLHESKISVAVVVQRMVESEVSGIAFSVHPVTEDRNQLIIEAGYGLGEAIVSGQITPDSYVVEKSPRRIIDKNVVTQERGIFLRPSTSSGSPNEWREIEVPKREKQKLSDEHILELSEIIIGIEQHYGFPCDIEWAFEGGKFYIVQSRPITTLEKETPPQSLFGNPSEWQRLFRVQGLRFLINDIWMEHYRALDVLATSINDEYVSYLPYRIMERTLEEGVELISNVEKFESYEIEFRGYMEGFQKFVALLDFENISQEDTKLLLNEITKSFFYYSKTEFFFTDRTYKLFEETKSKELENRLDRMGKIKNDGRSFLNSLFFGTESVLSKLISALEKHFGVPARTLQQYSREEILHLFDGNSVLDEEIERRNRAFYIFGRAGELIVKTGGEAEKEIQAFFGGADQTLGDTIFGTPAHRGKVQGIARVICAGYDNFDVLHKIMDTMQKGDILVAETTSPELIPACQKAGGIIADQGGMLSHAAIISRELQKPCIVGTSIATQVLKDGDLVEVDADNGVVRILKPEALVFQKNYTRDSSLSIQQSWSELCENLMSTDEWQNPYGPAVIDYFNQGATEVWENPKAMAWLMDRVQEAYAKLPETLDTVLKEYTDQLEVLKKYWHRGSADSAEELSRVAELIHEATRGFIVMYLLAIDERTPKKVRDIVEPMRKADVFFEENDRFMRRCLTLLFPEIAGYETAVLRSEITDLPTADVLRRRGQNFVLISNTYMAVETLQEYAAKHPEHTFLFDQVSDNVDELNGKAGFPGIAQGRVRVIRRKRDIHLLQQGEVLVAPMTTPDYVPAMKLAVAIVTDEGGMLCHAAIVARELKKPCIIGTKIATQVLHDGDLVEVDSDNGVVRILEKNELDRLIESINGKEWVYIVKRPVVPFMIEMIFEGERQERLQEILQESVHHVSNIRLNDGSSIYSKVGINSVNEAVKNIVSKDSYDGLVRLTEIFSERMKEFLEYLNSEHISLDGFRKRYATVSGFLVLGVFPERYLTEELQHLITKKCGTFDQDYFSAVAYPSELNDATKEVLALMDMALMMRREGVGVRDRVIHQKIEEHLKTYAWLGSRWSMEDGFTEHDIVTRLENYLRSSALEEEKENIEAPRRQADNKTKEFFVRYDLDDDEKKLVMAVKTFCFFRTHRSESLVRATFLLKQYIEQHPQEFPFGLDDIKYLTVTEILSDQTRENLRSLIRERKRAFVGVSVDGVVKILSGQECQQVTSLESIMNSFPHEVASQEITGQVGYGGVVQGKVKIVATEDDIAKVCSGDILVATMTFPHYIAAMEVASGFVTDEGGILCHAAIIAREMKKPCIIGTKIATQVLKNGDLVEVDAEKGVVRILERLENSNPVTKFITLMEGRKMNPPLNNYSFFGLGSAFNTIQYFGDYYPNLPPMHMIMIAKEGESFQMLPSDTFEYCSRYIFKSYLDGSKVAEKRFGDFDNTEKEISFLYEDFNTEKILGTEIDELMKIASILRDKIWHLNGYIFFTLYFDKEICWDVLKNTNSLISEDDLNLIWEKATHPAFESFEKGQRRSVLKNIADGKPSKFIAENARFIFTNYFGVESQEDVIRKINDEYGNITAIQAKKELDELDSEFARRGTEFSNWFDMLSRDTQDLVFYIQKIMEYRDRRKNIILKMYVIWWHIYEIILHEAGLDRSLVPYIQFDEMMRGPEYLKSRSVEIEARKNGSVLLIKYDGTITLDAIEYNSAKKQLTELYLKTVNSVNNESVIKGQTGSSGRVKGRICIVPDAKKSEYFKDGEILVTGMTRPEFVPLMKKALAIVTDEGGVTCHAAIVSRELGLPCVIGTKIATQVLHDGDLVEVDADNGVVTILERMKL